MARPREFDESEALQRALNLFWRHGYEATSLEQLLAATGLSKGSLYHAFGSKSELFETVLRTYQQMQAADIEHYLASEENPRIAFTRLIEAITRPTEPGGRSWGCLTCNSAVELAPHDPAIARIIADHHQNLEDIFADALARGQEAGKIRNERNVRATASFLVAALSGLQVLARAGAGRTRIEGAKRTVLSLLD